MHLNFHSQMPCTLGIINQCMQMIFARGKALDDKKETLCDKARVHIDSMLTQIGSLQVTQFGEDYCIRSSVIKLKEL